MSALQKHQIHREGAKDAKKTRGKLRALGIFAVRFEFFQWSHEFVFGFIRLIRPFVPFVIKENTAYILL